MDIKLFDSRRLGGIYLWVIDSTLITKTYILTFKAERLTRLSINFFPAELQNNNSRKSPENQKIYLDLHTRKPIPDSEMALARQLNFYHLWRKHFNRLNLFSP